MPNELQGWSSDYMPHGQCFLWEPGVLWLNVGSDLLIMVAYYTISASLFYFLYKRTDVPFRWMFVLFGTFIFACGTTHLIGVWTVWHPDYWIEGTVKAFTAALSFSTGVLLVPLLPKAMALRSPLELERLNASLSAALVQRQEAITTLEASRAQLMRRTEELTHQRQQLRELGSQLVVTEQRERRRLATELHDYLAQLLVVCRLNLSEARNSAAEPLKGLLASVITSLDECIKYTRTLVSELCPTALYLSGIGIALQQLADQMEKLGLHVTVQSTEPNTSFSDDDAILLYQTIRELLFNVLKHGQTDAAEVLLHRPEPHLVEAIVKDNGVGFDAAILQQHVLIDKFGLFSVRERLESLGGTLRVKSTPGHGTTVICRLPLHAEPGPTEDLIQGDGRDRIPATRKKQPQNTIRVLVVDDHAMVRQGIVSLLGSHGDISVIGEAADGEEAVRQATLLEPDVVVMDLNMPRVDGIQATTLIARRYPAICIIGLSVHQDLNVVGRFKAAGAMAFVTKTSVADELYDAIKSSVQHTKACDGDPNSREL